MIIVGCEIKPYSQYCRLLSLQLGELSPKLLIENITILWQTQKLECCVIIKTFKSETTPRSVLSSMTILSSLVKARW